MTKDYIKTLLEQAAWLDSSDSEEMKNWVAFHLSLFSLTGAEWKRLIEETLLNVPFSECKEDELSWDMAYWKNTVDNAYYTAVCSDDNLGMIFPRRDNRKTFFALSH